MRLHTVALDNLRRRRSRAAFLVVGLLVGIGTVVTLLTLSSSLTVAAQNDLESYGANIVVVPRTDDLSLAYGGVAVGGVSVGGRDLREADLQRIRTIPNRKNIAIIAPELLGVLEVRGQQTLLLGVRSRRSSSSRAGGSVDGRPPRGDDEVVAGSAAAARLGLAPGDAVILGGEPFTVSGVLRPTGSEDDEVLITDLAVAQRLLGKPGKVSMVEVAALCSNCPVEEIVAQIGAVSARHQGHRHAAGREEPHARARGVPRLQLRRRRRHHRHRGVGRLRHDDGFGERAHARDRHLPRPRLPPQSRHRPDPHRGGGRQRRGRGARLPRRHGRSSYVLLPFFAEGPA